ncbi:hypothetical protein [Legionella fairfieldensis]|uniref:hypothetical protein n=1 Tax=Legionella fairfieldensis TaxID=45064 RepID=UPI0004908685|nr:hypothetical protein [Legionella fairfieldensis]
MKNLETLPGNNHETTLQLIQSFNAVVKIISVSPDSDRCLDYILNQLGNPVANRPPKDISQRHRHRVANLKTGEWNYRPIEDRERGAIKNTEYTKKTDVTLLPPDGIIDLFIPKHGYPTGLIFDWNLCHQKDEKYIFPVNAFTDTKFWLKKQGMKEENQPLMYSLSMLELQNNLNTIRAKHQIPPTNNILAGLSKKSLAGVFALNNTLADRLRALYTQLRIKQLLGIDVPLFIINPQSGIVIYSEELQQQDLSMALRYEFFALPRKFINSIKAHFPQITHENNENTRSQSFQKGFAIFNELPEYLQEHTLSFLTLDELLKMTHTLSNNQKDKTSDRLILKTIQEKQTADLLDLLKTLKEAQIGPDFEWPEDLSNETYNSLINKHKPVFEDFIKKMNYHHFQERYQLIERVSAHLAYSQCELVEGILDYAIEKRDSNLLDLLLRGGTNPLYRKNLKKYDYEYIFLQILSITGIEKGKPIIPYMLKHHSLIIQITLYEERYCNKQEKWFAYEIGKINVRPLLLSALSLQPELISSLCNKSPAYLIETLKTMSQLEKMVKTIDRKIVPFSNYSSVILSYEPRALLLLQLNAKHHSHYLMNYSEKRLLENYLITQVKKLQSPQEVNQFWQKHEQAFYLNQHRHPTFDRLFHKKDPAIKTNVFRAVQNKLTELNATQNRNPGHINLN